MPRRNPQQDNGLKFLENAFLVKKQIGLKFKNIKTNMKGEIFLLNTFRCYFFYVVFVITFSTSFS